MSYCTVPDSVIAMSSVSNPTGVHPEMDPRAPICFVANPVPIIEQKEWGVVFGESVQVPFESERYNGTSGQMPKLQPEQQSYPDWTVTTSSISFFVVPEIVLIKGR